MGGEKPAFDRWGADHHGAGAAEADQHQHRACGEEFPQHLQQILQFIQIVSIKTKFKLSSSQEPSMCLFFLNRSEFNPKSKYLVIHKVWFGTFSQI